MPAPPVSALPQLKNLPQNLVDQVRQKFLEHVNSHPDQYQSEDLKEIQKNPWQTQRFLLEKKFNPHEALQAMLEAMQWRQQQKIKEIRPEDFPWEFYQSKYICKYGRDRNGAVVLYFRANIHRKTTEEWQQLLKRFFLFQIEQIDLNCDGKGVTLVIDCQQIGIKNIDLDLLKFIVETFSKFYPKLFDAIIINQLPFLLQYLFKLVQTWLPEDDRKFFHLTNSRKSLQEFIEEEQLPKFLRNDNDGKSSKSNPLKKMEHEQEKEEQEQLNQSILKMEFFIKKIGPKFGLSPGDEKKLNYLNDYI